MVPDLELLTLDPTVSRR